MYTVCNNISVMGLVGTVINKVLLFDCCYLISYDFIAMITRWSLYLSSRKSELKPDPIR